MLKFINLENGSIYSGIQPYIHWFPGQQSIGINYVMPIALLFDGEDVEENYKNIYIKYNNENSVFSLLNLPNNSDKIIINDFEYLDLEKLKKDDVKSIGVPVKDSEYYMHIFYVYAKSDSACECIDELTIYRKNPDNDEVIDIATINIGADFYNEDESLKINASNLGIHIPDSIQRAIYESDVHEETIDNILINRKLKELLSNYWDVIANRGSYKSLINSLKWFEYGDLVRLREIWSHNVDGSFEYDDREVSAIMNEKYKDAFNNFYKTTSFAIYLALQHETGELDIEKNPVLAENIFKWTLNDLAIKMSLLGNFYETYFMPIHTELLHCSIEDRIYTNNIKISNNVLNSCHDIVDCIESFKCTVNDGKEIILGNVNAQACESTPFVGEESMVGVSNGPIKEDVSNDKYFYNQYYNGIGSIIPIKCEFDVYGDERIVFGKVVWNKAEAYDYRLFANKSNNGKVTINFHLLVTKPTNKLNLFFISTSGKHYTKQIDIIARDNSYINLDVYRLKHIKEPIDSKYANPSDDEFIQYSAFSMGENDTHNFEYFISYKSPFTNSLDKTKIVKDDGIALSNVVFMNAKKIREHNKFKESTEQTDKNPYINIIDTLRLPEMIRINKSIGDYYFIYIPPTVNGKEPDHIVLISKYFYDDIYKYINDSGKEYIKFQDLRYIERFHTKEPIGDTNIDDSNDSIEKYKVGKYDDLYVTPQIHMGDKVYPLLYQHPQKVEGVTWKFINKSLNEESSYSDPREPYISSNSRKMLEPGYYDIEFNYKLVDGTSMTITKNSAFLKRDK